MTTEQQLTELSFWHKLTLGEHEELKAFCEGVRGEEWQRCIDLLDFDHSKCPIKETCIGYQNAQSYLMNQPPFKTNQHG